jgi:hypothetical protein
MANQGFQIVHAIPGRIRLKVGKVKGNTALAEDLQRKLSRISVVQHAEVSPLTGSIMATYDPRLIESLNSADFVAPHLLASLQELLALAEPLGIHPEDVDTASLEDWFQAYRNGTNPSSSSTVAGAVETFFSTLNAKVAQASSGWSDLKVLLPLALFFLGIRGLLLAEKVPVPAWYDYLWFAFGTFIALHPTAAAPKQA